MEKKQKYKLYTMFLLALIATIAMVTASYAWLGISRVPFVSDINLSIMTYNALWIAHDVDGQPGEWESYLDMSAILEDMVPLKPVTYADGAFYKVNYGEDGRPAGLSPIAPENINVTYPDGDTGTKADEAAEQQGWMIRLDYWLKAEGATADVFLGEAMATADGRRGAGTYVVGEPVWNDTVIAHENGGNGAETTIRFGFACTNTDLDGVPTGDTIFTVYEPNADIHADGSLGYVETQSAWGGPLVDMERLVRQEASTWTEQTPVLQDVVIYEMGDFLSNPALFTLVDGGMVKVTMYIWMEGQDIDCSNMAVADETAIAANIQFKVSPDSKYESDIVPR